MKIPFLDLHKQYLDIKSEIDQAIEQVITNTAFVGGSYVEAFEGEFARFCNAAHCVGVGNGTDAITILLRAMGVGPGHEVIVPANSFIATSEAVTSAGASVVFVDVDARTYNIDPAQLEARITSRTRAIIAVHLYGQPADMDPILEVARRRRLLVIEDSAQAHGATYKGRTIGSIGDAACFSFYPGKNLGAYGDGGAIVTSDDKIATKARMIANHGRIDKYNHEIEGVNSRLDGLQAAILSVKLKHLPSWTEARRAHAKKYSALLANTDVVTPVELSGASGVYHLYVIRVAAEKRDELRTHLQNQGVSTGIHYPIALPNLLAYQYLGHGAQDFPVSTKASSEILSLPMFAELTDPEIAHVCESATTFLARQPAIQKA
jgi:dTDP-4-amino-4,6-dideoxygalactose transaminase